jgi:putative FmdB family regulatory protein
MNMYKVTDFICKACDHITEYLVDTNKPDDKPVCEKCSSTSVEAVLTLGTGKKTHPSWSSWRVSV